MLLKTLKLVNFKGVKDFTLSTNGGNVAVYGDNATGKTTIFDGLTYLLFDKDSANRKDFEIKTLDPTGQPIHGLSHEVEGTFEIGGKTLTLRKVYAEKWTKKRGSATAAFTGHTVDHFIDGVPVKKTEFATCISQIVNEDIFKLLTNPTFFNEQLHWQKRRDILMEVCGDLSDQEVILSDKSLAELPKILGDRKLDDHRKVITARRAEINKELDRIPVRIDEAARSLPDITGINVNVLLDEITLARDAISEKREQIARIEGGGEIAEKTKVLREAEGELLDIRNRHRANFDNKIREKDTELRQAQVDANDLKVVIAALERKQASLTKDAEQLEAQLPGLRERWINVNDQVFKFEQNDTCPTCGQYLPAEQLAEAREKALAAFNREKAETLGSITATGKGFREQLVAISAATTGVVNEIAMARRDLEQADSVAMALQAEVETLRREMELYTADPAYVAKQGEVDTLKQVIVDLKDGRSLEADKVRDEITALEIEVKANEIRLADVDRHQNGQARIIELKAQERKLAAEYERLEKEHYLCDQFVRAKVNLLEELINSRFKLARFKLFDVQVNGGLAECCETLYNGVPYSGGLNNAARINVGLDIINTLAEHYGFAPPVFADNAEAVTRLAETRGQQIRLVVSEQDKQLRVEVEKTIKEAV